MERDFIQSQQTWQKPSDTLNAGPPKSPKEALRPLERLRPACISLLKQRAPIDDARMKNEGLLEGTKVYYDSAFLRVMICGANLVIHGYDRSQWERARPRFAMTLSAGKVDLSPQDMTMAMIAGLPPEFFDELIKLGAPFEKIARALSGR